LFDIDLRNFLDQFKGAKRNIYNNWNEVINIKESDVNKIYDFISEGWEVRKPTFNEKTKRYTIQYR
jgi:hypothetical protein